MSRGLFALVFLASCTTSGLRNETPEVDNDAERVLVGAATADTIVTCDNTFDVPPEGELCTVSGDASTATHLLIQGDVLGDLAAFEQGAVLMERGSNGVIECVGCDCADDAPESTLVLTCPDGVVSPGLINAHDHLGFDLSDPAPHGDERFDHRHDWRRGRRGHTRLPARSDNSRESQLYSELRMLLAGTTSLAGSVRGTSANGLLRNLDAASSNGGLGLGQAEYRTFPLGDSSGTMSSTGCSRYSIDNESRLNNRIYLPHVAEGIDENARNEFLCLSGQQGGRDLIAENTSIIHGVALKAEDISVVADAGAKLVWSPRSNISLYGETAPVSTYRSFGVDIAMGTDWTPSGSATMLRELQCADYLNTHHYGQVFSDRELWAMATRNGGIAMGFEEDIGRLREGYVADIALFDGRDRSLYRAVLDAGIADVELVLRGSQVLTGDRDIVEGLLTNAESSACDALDECVSDHVVCLEDDTGLSLDEVTDRVSGYPLYICDVPDDEPSCVPLRNEGDALLFPVSDVDDLDGDGILDAEDNCPGLFNPPLPMNDYLQADSDFDGLGDVCDPCPLSSANVCNWRDADGDGVLDIDDNCPDVSNADQADADGDSTGDACANGVPTPPPCEDCQDSVYDLKQGALSVGDAIRLEGLQVTGVASSGFFAQVPSDSPDWDGPQYAGVYVYLGSTPPVDRGDRINLSAAVSEHFGQLQVNNVNDLDVVSSGHVDPEPTLVASDAIATGGTLAASYEGLLVRVENALVTDTNLSPGAGESSPTGAFELDGRLRVDDMMFGFDPDVGDVFASLTGILRFANGNSKLEARDADDRQDSVSVGLWSLSPATLSMEAGAPEDLVLTLSAPATNDTFVFATCTPASVLACGSVTVPAGSSTVALPIDGIADGVGTVTATLGSSSVTAEVTVWDDSSARDLTLVSVGSQTLEASTSTTVTVELSLPAGSNGTTIDSVSDGFITAESVVVAPGQTTATLTVVAGPNEGPDELLLSANGSVLSILFEVTVDDVVVTPPPTPTPTPTNGGLFFSRYLEGSSGNNKFLELTNASGVPVDLSACTVDVYGNGSTSPTSNTLSGVLPSGGAFIVCHSSANYPLTTPCDNAFGSLGFNGDDAIGLSCDGALVDVIGEIGHDPGSAWGTTVSTRDSSLVRSCDIVDGDPNGADAFEPADEWTVAAQDDASAFGSARICP